MSDVTANPPPEPDLAGLTGLYALDALDEPLLGHFEAYLETNAEARAEVAEFRATAALLDSVVAETPPAGLRDRVMAEVANTRQEAPVVQLAPRRVARRNRGQWMAVAAALILIAAVGGLLLGRATGPQSELAGLLDRPDARVVALHGEGDSVANVVWSSSAGRAMVVASSMPEVPSNKTMELWRIDGEKATSIGTFTPGSDRSARASFAVDLDGATSLGLTVEPAGGSATPTLPIVMSGTV